MEHEVRDQRQLVRVKGMDVNDVTVVRSLAAWQRVSKLARQQWLGVEANLTRVRDVVSVPEQSPQFVPTELWSILLTDFSGFRGNLIAQVLLDCISLKLSSHGKSFLE